MNESSTLRPLRFRFTHEPDAKAYNNPADPDGWWRYDEAALTGLPFSELVELEQHIAPITLIEAMQGLRLETVLGMHVMAWVAMHTANPAIAGPYKAFKPRDILIYWELIPDEVTEASDPLDSKTSPSSAPAESSTPSAPSKPRSRTKRVSRPTR